MQQSAIQPDGGDGAYRAVCGYCGGTGVCTVEVKQKPDSFSRGHTETTATSSQQTCKSCNGTGQIIGRFSSLSELRSYLSEPCDIQDKIFDLIDLIMKRHPPKGQDDRWILMTKRTKSYRYESREDEGTLYTFYLDSGGKLRCSQSDTEYVRNSNGGYWANGPKTFVEFDRFDDYMREFDFRVQAWHHTQYLNESTELAFKADLYSNGEENNAHIVRDYKKGYGLYSVLKKIAEGSQLSVNAGKRASQKSAARTERPYKLAKAAVIVPTVFMCLLVILWEIRGMDSFLNLFLTLSPFYAIFLFLSLIYLNYENAKMHEWDERAGIRFWTFMLSPMIAFLYNVSVNGVNSGESGLLDLKPLGVIVVIFLITAILCEIKIRSKR